MIRHKTLVPQIIFALLLAGCTRPSAPAEARVDQYPIPADVDKVSVQGKFGGRVVHPILRPPRSFNPLAASDEDTLLVTSLTSGTLIEMERSGMSFVPALAKSWQLENGGKTIRLQLRNGVRFSDNTPFSADDVVFTFDAIYADNSHNIRKDDLILHDRKIKYTRLADDQVLLEFPFAYGPALYLLSTVPILPKHRLGPLLKEKPIEALMGLESAQDQWVGLGAFRIKQARSNEQIILEPNAHYWRVDSAGRRLPYLDEIILPVVNSRDSAFMQFRSGALDMVDRLRVEDYASLARKQSDNFEVKDVGASANLQLLWANQNSDYRSVKKVYFDKPQFRQAMAHTIDRKALINNVFHGQAGLLSELWPPSLRNWSSDIAPYQYDPAMAIDLYTQAGLKLVERSGQKQLTDPTGQPFSLVLLTNTDPVKGAIATMLQEDFRRVGIQLQISQNDQRAVIDRFLNKRDYELVLFSSFFPPQPAALQSLLLSRGEQHFWNPAQRKPATPWEAEIDRLSDEMITAVEPAKSKELFDRIQKILMEQMPVIPLVAGDVLVGLRKNVKNVRPSVLPPHLLWNSWELYVN